MKARPTCDMPTQTDTADLTITGMTCAACQAAVQRALRGSRGFLRPR